MNARVLFVAIAVLLYPGLTVAAMGAPAKYNDMAPQTGTITKADLSAGIQSEANIILPISAVAQHIAYLQVLLDRVGFSPGVINGREGKYLNRALLAYAADTDDLTNAFDDLDVIENRLQKNGGAAFKIYHVTQEDIEGPFLNELPARIQDQGHLKRLGFMRVQEAIAEQFHMDETFLISLNPDVDWKKAGSAVIVANVGRPLDLRVTKIHADKKLKQLIAYGKDGKVLAHYPASIGSTENPSPKGVFKVRNKAGFPAYTLSANNTFEPIDDGRQVVVAPGPNNPVGIAWIGLSKKSYGIHGTPEPSSIGSAESHGCIRLTNWDAMELARVVQNGVEVTID